MKSMEAEKNKNGYANHETWAVCLWLENDEESWGYWIGAAKEATEEAATCWQVRDRIWESRRAPASLLAMRLEGEITEGMPELGAGLYSKLLGSALYEVEWHEVAEAILEAEFWSQAF